MNHASRSPGVSIITCTKRPNQLENIFANYLQQNWTRKELIIILNNDAMMISQIRNQATKYQNVSVFQLPEKTSLGKCLNYGVNRSKYEFIAKFDDDDYYGPNYILDSMNAFRRTNADIVGKRAIFNYLEDKKLLVLLYPNHENKFVDRIGGGTMVVRRKVFRSVRFADITIGEDSRFQRICRRKGFKIYSSSRFHFVGIRRKNNQDHTWRVSNRFFKTAGKPIAITDNYRQHADKSGSTIATYPIEKPKLF